MSRALPLNAILRGDALDVLRSLPSESVHTIITSPPYWGLRDYGAPGQLGLEPTPDEYVTHMVEVFREARRVLRSDGSLWLNLGDSYAAQGTSGLNDNFRARDTYGHGGGIKPNNVRDKRARHVPSGLKPKDLVGIPWRVAFALQSDGWWLRSDIIWHKPNCMPESVRDRPTKSHEYVFLLTKSERYYYDADAISEPANNAGREYHPGPKSLSLGQAKGRGVKPSGNALKDVIIYAPTRNRRDVWSVATAPYRGAHFAVMPPALVEPCVLAGCPAGGVILDPFMGAGTVAVVARKHSRHYLGIELNADYIALAEARIAAETRQKPAPRPRKQTTTKATTTARPQPVTLWEISA